jgi:hypothetical protein
MKRAVPVWTRLDWAIAAVAGVALGVALGTTRNAMSDEAMYRSISSTPTIESYRLYLSRGGRHSDEVRDVLLPRAELREAETQGTVEAVRTFAQAHPSTKIGPEVDAVLRRGMLGELEKAKKAGTVGALDEFAKNYPDHNVDAELKSARHALYARALGAWKDKTHAAAPTKAFVERLLAWAEKAGPVCEVRFRLKPSKTLEDADKSIMKNEHYPGADALPSKYMTASAMRPREERVAQSVAQAFASAFPSDMLDVRSGEPLAADAPVPTNMPTLVVEYAPEWAHANTLSMKPPTVFAGISLGFDASFMLPQGDPVKISTKASRGPELWKIKGGGMTREDFEQKVYDTMIDAAFDQLEKKLNDAFF